MHIKILIAAVQKYKRKIDGVKKFLKLMQSLATKR